MSIQLCIWKPTKANRVIKGKINLKVALYVQGSKREFSVSYDASFRPQILIEVRFCYIFSA